MSEPVFVFISSFNVAQCIEQLRGLSEPLQWLKIERQTDQQARVLLADSALFIGLIPFFPRDYAIIDIEEVPRDSTKVTVTLVQHLWDWDIGFVRWLPREIAQKVDGKLQPFKLQTFTQHGHQGFVSPHLPDVCISRLKQRAFDITHGGGINRGRLVMIKDDHFLNSVVLDYSLGEGKYPIYHYRVFLTFYPLEPEGSYCNCRIAPKLDWGWVYFVPGLILVTFLATLDAEANKHVRGIITLLGFYGLLVLDSWLSTQPHLTRTQLLASVKQWLDAMEMPEVEATVVP